MQIFVIEAIILLFLIVIAIAIILNKDLWATVIIYCVFSFCTMLLYTMMGAPDVAFTEAIIGIVSTIYFIIAIRNTDRRCK
ncbi:energy-converting hydrogenase B subunit D [Clostridiales Family XIII bacterium PM5-7]